MNNKHWLFNRTYYVSCHYTIGNIYRLPFRPGASLLPRVAATAAFYRLLAFYFLRRTLLFQNHPT